MSSTFVDLFDDIHSSTSADEDIIHIPTSSTTFTGAAASSYTSDQLQRLLTYEKQKYSILTNESVKTLAPWWRSFGYPAVVNEENQFQRIPGFISCFECFHTSNYGSRSGTKRFITHADRCSPMVQSSSSADGTDDSHSTQLTLKKLVVKKKVKLSSKEQKELKDLYAKWVCSDIRPYSIVEDKGFEELAQTFIRIGAQHGLVDVKELLRSRQTVARTVNDLALEYRLDLKNELREPLKSKSVTICPDFWSNKYNQQSFLGLNITYVTIENEFKCIDLFCIPFNGVKSYDAILAVLRRQLLEYGITDLSDLNIMSDRGANFVKAFALYNPIYCFGHRLNNILKICFFQVIKKKNDQNNLNSLNDNPRTTKRKNNVTSVILGENSSSDSESESSEIDEENEELNVITEDTLINFQKKKSRTIPIAAQKMSVDDIPPEAKKIILLLKQTKDLVKYVKQAGLNPEIKAAGGKTLHQACVVRWLSLSNLLESVINSFKITKKLLLGKQKQDMINDLNVQSLKQLVMLLKPFKNMMTIIQCGNSPSLHLVSLCYITLKELLISYELLKQYNKDNRDEDEKDQDSELLYDDDDLEHELPGIKWFRERLLLLMKEMFVLDIRHVAATLLHPRYRCLKKFPDHIKNQCHRYICRQVRRLRDEAELEIQLQQTSTEPTKKKFKSDKNLFSRFESQNFDEEVNDAESSSGSEEFDYDIKKGDELDRYLLYEFEKNDQSTEPLRFWRTHRNQFPFLSQYARSLLSIPATSTNVEREFSTAGWILNQRRTSLKPEQVDKILFVRSMDKQLKKK